LLSTDVLDICTLEMPLLTGYPPQFTANSPAFWPKMTHTW
jgi:hypothetical protein